MFYFDLLVNCVDLILLVILGLCLGGCAVFDDCVFALVLLIAWLFALFVVSLVIVA